MDFNPDQCLAPAVIDAAADWAVVSFHTVPAEELVEERPDDSREAGTKQMTYLGSEK